MEVQPCTLLQEDWPALGMSSHTETISFASAELILQRTNSRFRGMERNQATSGKHTVLEHPPSWWAKRGPGADPALLKGFIPG